LSVSVTSNGINRWQDASFDELQLDDHTLKAKPALTYRAVDATPSGRQLLT